MSQLITSSLYLNTSSQSIIEKFRDLGIAYDYGIAIIGFIEDARTNPEHYTELRDKTIASDIELKPIVDKIQKKIPDSFSTIRNHVADIYGKDGLFIQLVCVNTEEIVVSVYKHTHEFSSSVMVDDVVEHVMKSLEAIKSREQAFTEFPKKKSGDDDYGKY